MIRDWDSLTWLEITAKVEWFNLHYVLYQVEQAGKPDNRCFYGPELERRRKMEE